MLILAAFNPTQTDRGLLVAISGRIFDTDNVSISNAVISIQVNDPERTSIHVAIAYTNLVGFFEDAFLLALNSPGGNYTAWLIVDKPGYETASITLTFAYSTPDFSLETSVSTLSLKQGQTGSLMLTILSHRAFDQQVDFTALDPPTGVSLQFNPASVIPSGTTTVNVAVSGSAPVGNYTVTVLAVSGSLSHKVSFQLHISPGPFQADLMFLAGGTGSVVTVLTAIVLHLRSRGKRRRREAAIDELIKQASADTGYVATARVIARLEELRAMGKVDEETYQRLKKDYEKRLEKSR